MPAPTESPPAGSPADPMLPDYDDAWLGAVMPALAAARRGDAPPWVPSAIDGARAAVLFVLDGLGWTMLRRHADRLPNLAALEGGAITSVVPTTTAAALTSLTTSVPPAVHGIVGYRFRVGGETLNALQWKVRRGAEAPDPVDVQPVLPFGGVEVPVISRREFAETGFTAAHLRGAALHGWVTPGTIGPHVDAGLATGASVVYAYWDGVDKVAHAHGLHDEFLAAELVATDQLVADLRARLPGDVALVVTADHGHVHVDPRAHRDVGAELGEVLGGCAGEARFRSLLARPGGARELAEAAEERFGDVAWVRTREQVLDEGWLGPGLRPTVSGRFGDVVLAAREPVALLDPAFPPEANLLGLHGSLTEDELLVPFLAGRGGA